MGSNLAWLDSSREDQQRMRELIGMFSDKESLDELGIGQVRDAISDLLFPGTSSLHTRARYLLIVPWCYQVAQRQGRTGTGLTSQVEMNERTVVGTLNRAGVTDGVVGRRAGVAVKTLPSSIYWTALAQFGIRHGDQIGSWGEGGVAGNSEAEELTERSSGMWHPTLPLPPAGFPYELPGGLDLQRHEAQWLRDRILAGASGTLLAHLIRNGSRPADSSEGPWDDRATSREGGPTDELEHAKLFSLGMHGAALLYNLLVAELYEEHGFTTVENPVADFRDRFSDWAGQVAARRGELGHWDQDDMWRRVSGQNPRISNNLAMRSFVNTWLDAVVSGAAPTVADSPYLRRLVQHREETAKRAQSRFLNERMLRTWSGASGSSRLTFRWRNVRRLVNDVANGLTSGGDDAPS
jgi:hypothetical protein